MLKKFRLEDSKPTKTPMLTKIKLIKDDEADSVDCTKYRGEIIPQRIQMDYKCTKVYLPRIHRSRKMDEDLRESYRTLEKRLFNEGRFVTPSFIKANNMLPSFLDVGLDPFFTLKEPICPRFVVEFYPSLEFKRDEEECPYIEFKLGRLTFELNTSELSQIFQTLKGLEIFYTSKWSLNSLDDHPNSRFFSPKHDLVRKNITIPRTTQTQLQRDPNKLYTDDLCHELKGWELFLKENFFCTIGNRDHKTPSPPLGKKSLSPPLAPSKSIFRKSTHYTSSSSPKFPPLASSANDPYVSTIDNWPSGPSKPSPPTRVTRPPPGFPHPPPGFEQLTTTQPLFVNINNNAPHLHNNALPHENIQHPPPNLRNQDFHNPSNILDFVHPNDMPQLQNMFCQCCSTTRHAIQILLNRVNYMFSYIRHHFGSSSNPPYFPH
uniref:Uncharacterized mitochondrial protein AtMg00810-like n=1 Tax=Tanacetum cinerariifolium TaxID=118510 RepID=A0A699H948_TANCI|nr:uncharacterized mitochondrial protein AtMg00810-like [Tanacetum cinerariifolium]GEX63279.1 uncharacterized mitochondrial protein AtMg00810-like [Tanacetum cinerariifolium]